MMLKGEGMVCGYSERKAKDGRVYRAVDVYVKGKESGNLRLNVPEESQGLVEQVKAAEGRQARVTMEVRKFDSMGKHFFDLTGLEVLK